MINLPSGQAGSDLHVSIKKNKIIHMKILKLLLLFIVTVSFSQERYTGPIIDMHLHGYTDEQHATLFGIPHPITLRGESFMSVKNAEEQKVQTLELMKKYNIVVGVVTDGQTWKTESDDRILVARNNIPVDDLRVLIEKKDVKVIAEVAPFYGNMKADDESLDPLFKLAYDTETPIGVHILPGGPNNGIHLMPQMLGGMRAKNASPLQLESILIKYPGIKLYIMHGGWPYVDDVKALMYMHSNLYVDIAVLNWVLPKEECYNFIKSLMDAGFSDRIMYGTDQMGWPIVIEKGIETIQSADFLSLQHKEDIFYNNAARFLEFPDEVIKRHKSK